MSRIPTHTVEDAPAASRPLLQKIVQSTPGGRPANLHAQMAHSPAVLTAYTSLRAVLAEHTTFDPKLGAALTLATAAGVGNDYMIRIANRLAHMNGWSEEQATALRTRRVCFRWGNGVHGIFPQLRANRNGCLWVDRAELMQSRRGSRFRRTTGAGNVDEHHQVGSYLSRRPFPG
jgi:hypothetical protein